MYLNWLVSAAEFTAKTEADLLHENQALDNSEYCQTYDVRHPLSGSVTMPYQYEMTVKVQALTVTAATCVDRVMELSN